MSATTPPRTAFVVVDVQNDFCPGGALAVPDGDAVIPVINRLLTAAPRTFDLVVFTQDWHPPGHISFATRHGKAPFTSLRLPCGTLQHLWPEHCVQHTRGAALHPALTPPESVSPHTPVSVVRKAADSEVDAYSGFWDVREAEPQGLAEVLEEARARRVVVAGLAVDFCVGQTARHARKKGWEVWLVEDAVRGVAEDSSEAMVEELRELGVRMVTSEEVSEILAAERGSR